MRVVWLVLAVLAVVALLWIGGEAHRENCLHQGRTGCSVLPWSKGKAKRGGNIFNSPSKGLNNPGGGY